MSFWRLSAALAAAAVVALTLLACGDTVIDQKKAEDTTKASLEDSLREPIASVDCPSGQEVKAEAVFSCEVRFPGGREATANLKILNKDADVRIVGIETKK